MTPSQAARNDTSARVGFISAGDVSGEGHAARLLQELRAREPEWRWIGLGGEAMAQAGCRLLAPPEREPVMGFSKVIRRIPRYVTLLARLSRCLEEVRPRLVVLVDYPGLNLRIARLARRHGIPVVYFICPQLWAWAPWRMKAFARLVDLALVIFPFEESFFRTHGVETRYIGHPVCDRRSGEGEGGTPPLPPGEKLALLPGSRRQEVEMNLPVMLHTARVLQQDRPGLVPVLSHYDPAILEIARNLARGRGVPLETIRGGMEPLAASARLCLVGSGTATLEVAFSGTPFVVIYRIGPWARRLAPLVLTVPWFCQVNLMAGERMVPEFLVHESDAPAVVAAARALLRDGPERDALRARLRAFREAHFKPGAIRRAAEILSRRFGGAAVAKGLNNSGRIG